MSFKFNTNLFRFCDVGLIDYSSKLGQSIYKQSCDKLTNDEGFPMIPATTMAFVKAFENRCTIMGWNQGAQNITNSPTRMLFWSMLSRITARLMRLPSRLAAERFSGWAVRMFRVAPLKATT